MAAKDKFSFLSMRERAAEPAPAAPPAAAQNGWIDAAFQIFGHLVVVGWSASHQDPNSLLVSFPKQPAVRLKTKVGRFRRDDVNQAAQDAGRRVPELAGFMAVSELDPEFDAAASACAEGHKPIGVRLELPSADIIEVKIPVATLRQAIEREMLTEAMVAALDSTSVEMGAGRAKLGALVRAVAAPKPMLGHVDNALTADGENVLIVGWAQSADQSELFFADPTLGLRLRAAEALHFPRDDVAAHVSSFGASSRTNRFGLVAAAPGETLSEGVRLCAFDGETVRMSAPLQVRPQRAPIMQVLSVMRTEIEKTGPNFSGAVERVAANVMPRQVAAPEVEQVLSFEPAGAAAAAAPLVSIIVPFYAEGYYLLDHLVGQSRAPANVEWIFVCDDPILAPSLVKNITYRQSLIRQPTKLVLLKSNGGYSHANNIGLRYASAPFVLLMNSDIYARDYAFVEYAANLFQADAKVGLVGFSLQFEDGTIQHDGIEFRRAPWFGDLWASEHPRKGMPHSWRGFSKVEVDAVTAALMMLRRADIHDGLIFDAAYHIGDFEDADLCLRTRNNGKSIVLVRTDGIFHLERQSVRHMGHSHGREVVTRMNCRRFNDRWQVMLDQIGVGTAARVRP